jgi:anti-sigma factor RsiW
LEASVSCSSSEALFERYLDGTLTPARRAGVRAHLRTCGRCTGVFEELRVVDALLASPTAPELPANFTFATMAEVRALPRPHVSSPPLVAYLVCYLVAAWLVIGAAFLVENATMRILGGVALGVSRQEARTLGGLAHAAGRFVGDAGTLGTLFTFALAVGVAVALALLVGVVLVRPRIAARLRS